MVPLRCLAVIFSMWLVEFSGGHKLAFPSTALPDIASGNYGFKFPSTAMSAWYVSCSSIISIFGIFVASQAMDKYGRKMALMLALTLHALGWLITSCSNGITCMFIGRVLISLSDSPQQSACLTTTSEVVPKEIRGTAVFIVFTGYMAGITVSYICGTFMSWRWLSVVSIGIDLAAITCVYLFIPESPRWLIMTGKRELAIDNLKKLRQHSTNFKDKIETEITEMEQSWGMNESISFFKALGRLIKPPLLQPFVLINVALFFQQFSGASYIKTFTVTIFKMGSTSEDSSNNEILSNPHYQTILVGLSGLLSTLLTAPAADSLGRRPCFILSGSVVTLSLSALTIYFWLYRWSERWTANTIGWLPLVALMCFNVGFGIAYCPGPAVLVNEMFPTTLRATSTFFFNLGYSVCYFIVVQLFGGLDIEPHIMFTIFAIIGIIGVLFFVLFLPETKGKTLEEIEKFWIKKPDKACDAETISSVAS